MAFLNGVRILFFKQEAEKLANLDAVARAVEAMGSQVNLGKALGITAANIGMCVTGYKDVPARWCMPIEIVTEGRVRAAEIRPDLFDKEFISKSLVTEQELVTRKYFDFKEETV